jgi:uncharacterized protein YbaR (Trm112 family)
MPILVCPKCQQPVWIGDNGICPTCKGTSDKGTSDGLKFSQRPQRSGPITTINVLAGIIAGLFLVIGARQGQGIILLIIVPIAVFWFVKGILSAPGYFVRALKGKKN